MNLNIPLNLSARRSTIVDETLTARAIGSGALDVLATPMLIALMEAASVAVVEDYLPEETTSVGTRVEIDHIRATPTGRVVTAEAVLLKVIGRTLEFAVSAEDGSGQIGQGTHRRVVVDIGKFLEKLHEA